MGLWLLTVEEGLLRFLRAQVTDGDNGDKPLRRDCLERRRQAVTTVTIMPLRPA